MGMYNSIASPVRGQQSWGQPQTQQTMVSPGQGQSLNMPVQNSSPTNTVNIAPRPTRGMNQSLSKPGLATPQNFQQSYQEANPYYSAPQQMANPGVPGIDEIQAEMARRNVGVQLNANPANSALAGYMFG